MIKPIPFEFKVGDIVKRKVDNLWDFWLQNKGTDHNYTVLEIKDDKIKLRELYSTFDTWRFELISRPMPVEPRKPRTGEGYMCIDPQTGGVCNLSLFPGIAAFGNTRIKMKWTEVLDCKEVENEKARYTDCPCKAHSTPY